MSGPMTPTAKHRETAEALIASRIDSMCMTWDHSFGLMDEQQREGLRRNFRQIAYHDLTPFVAIALAKAEREGMKRAAEIASLDADWSRFGKREVHEPWEGGPDDARDYRIGIVAGRAIAAAILSEAGEG